jgi:hypothetical protein|tara:strand:+ start:3430 stop:4491 length:1062 start_codon:yes stop_codon:yes gene_type:complete
LGYANGASIRTLRLKEDGRGFGFITSGVQGTARAPYRVELYFMSDDGVMELTPDQCSCPVGMDCKHAAAVLLYLEKRGKLYSAAHGIVPTGPQLDWHAEDWLRRMKSAAAANVKPEKQASSYNKFLAYCLLTNPHRPEPVLSLRLGNRLKSGAVSMGASYPTADTSNPPKYMADEDILLVIRLRSLQRNHYSYDGLSLDTQGSMKLLQDVLATGRLFAIDPTNRKGLLPVAMGPAEQVKAVWEILPDGAMKPALEFSLKAGGTGLNLTAADTVIHYDPWWNPAAENQATDRAHRIGQTKPVFVHKLACRGTIEDRILDLQKHKSALVEALLSAETSKLKIDSETLSHLLSPLE